MNDYMKGSKRWVVTGVAGFIGSHLLEELLRRGQDVIGIDNLSSGSLANLEDVRANVGPCAWSRFTLLQADVRDLETCRKALAGADVVLHQAALGSVPRSVENPLASNEHNVTGFLTLLVAAKEAKVGRVIYATSSSVYGDNADLPKKEECVGNPLSPYAVTKAVNESYARVYWHLHRLPVVGLRYFNVFGSRQSPNGPYAAVIPRWYAALVDGRSPEIYGDGSTSRDFCYVKNVVRGNLLAAAAEDSRAFGRAFNIACGQKTSLLQLFNHMRIMVSRYVPKAVQIEPIHLPERSGDIRHSLADVSAARELLGYQPEIDVVSGLSEITSWYVDRSRNPVRASEGSEVPARV